jgi:hypothetical protein
MVPLAVALANAFAVTYVAGADCPTQATFEAAVLARAPHAHRAGEGEAPDVSFEAVLETPRRLRIQRRRAREAQNASRPRSIRSAASTKA